MVVAAGCTDVGCVREHNEDHILVDVTEQFFIVADGMGGERGGAEASRIAVETVQECFTNTSPVGDASWPFGYLNNLDLVQNRMLTAIKLANRNIRIAAQADEFEGMGSTLVVLYVRGNIAVLGSVGDSRIYLCRSGALRQVTHDDSYIGDLLQAGAITEAEAAIDPHRNMLTEAVGARDDIKVEVSELELVDGDRLMMCSDGLHGVVEDEVIEKALSVRQDPDATTRYLVARARRAGGPDNISCIVIDYKGR